MDFLHLLLIFLTLGVMLVGLAGTVIPALPGIELIWLATVAYWVVTGFDRWGIILVVLMTVLLIIGEVMSFFLANTTAAQTGASWQAIAASLVLGLIGMFVIPIIGALIGAVLGVFLVEWYRRRNWREALRATTGAVWGYGLSIGAQFVVALMMIGLWGVWVFGEWWLARPVV
jgi:hypothetical protein